MKKLATRAFGLAILTSIGLSLGGCLQPLYGPQLQGRAGTPLSAISVEPIDGFIGHELKNQLDFALTGGVPAPQKFRLRINTRQAIGGTIVDVQTGRAQTATLTVTADYVLEDAATGDPISRGSVLGSASFDRTQQRFASVRAGRDAETRAARMITDILRARLAAALLVHADGRA